MVSNKKSRSEIEFKAKKKIQFPSLWENTDGTIWMVLYESFKGLYTGVVVYSEYAYSNGNELIHGIGVLSNRLEIKNMKEYNEGIIILSNSDLR